MLKLALVFFLISLVAGFLGFSGVSAATAGIAKVFFVGFLVVALALTIGGVVLGKKLLKS